ncbi:MAG: hypothetical protein ACJAU2_000648 [Maribacter sp.]|jgi:hypothetical protein
MKNLSWLVVLFFGVTALNAQAFDGKGDSKFQIGASFQSNGTGISATFDRGLGENFSIGLSSGYVLGLNADIDADFVDRINLTARFNANIGSVLNLGDAVDIYPGLNLSLRQFGGHLGGRYFFSDGFGVFTEFSIPFAKYENGTLSNEQLLNNQFIFGIGTVFNL